MLRLQIPDSGARSRSLELQRIRGAPGNTSCDTEWLPYHVRHHLRRPEMREAIEAAVAQNRQVHSFSPPRRAFGIVGIARNVND